MTVLVSWHDAAACRGADPELFFPVGATESALPRVAAAKQVCRACPVQAQCLAWALDNDVADGVWGGTTADERVVIRRVLWKKGIGQRTSRGH
jgi:WhiB family transcriptional regulator, redox-sensing transcriptional regulator